MKKLLAAALTAVLCLGILQSHPAAVRAETIMEEEPVVIVLDPGHGGSDGGAVRTWGGRKYKEKSLNLAIARYCKAELEQYAGVTVYLTRPGDTYVTLGGRVAFAAEVDADLFVSLHNNADTKISSRGACVFYPNTKYRKSLSEQGEYAAACIQNRLMKLGIKNNGIGVRNSENKTKYPNKKTADYYFVIRECKLRNIPGIIVEHAYVSNPTDCRLFLSSDARLKKLGIADAGGIADCYGLVKGSDTELISVETQPDGSVLLEWTEAEKMDGYSVYRRLAEEDEEFERIATVSGKETTEYTDNSASEAGVYEYCVRAYVENREVCRYTAYSEVMQAARVPAPMNVFREQTENGTVRLTWSEVDGADGYVIARRADGEESFLVVAEPDGDLPAEWVDETAWPEDSYEYQICAYIETEDGRALGPYVSDQQLYKMHK